MSAFIQLVRFGAVVFLVGYAAFFIVQNGDRRLVVLPFIASGELQTWIVVLLSTAFGMLAASLGWSWLFVRKRGQLRRDAKRIGQLERELHGLRTLPLGEKSPEPLTTEPARGAIDYGPPAGE